MVIGETCRIGEGVTLYQGVTLGAWSFPRDEEGQLIRGAAASSDTGRPRDRLQQCNDPWWNDGGGGRIADWFQCVSESQCSAEHDCDD